jgi:hypothetical protein
MHPGQLDIAGFGFRNPLVYGSCDWGCSPADGSFNKRSIVAAVVMQLPSVGFSHDGGSY